MECKRLEKLIKNWYLQVQAEAMAPARMIAFMEKHLPECPVCLADPRVKGEVAKINAFILPEVKIRKPSEEDGAISDDDSVEDEPAGDDDLEDEQESEEDI